MSLAFTTRNSLHLILCAVAAACLIVAFATPWMVLVQSTTVDDGSIAGFEESETRYSFGIVGCGRLTVNGERVPLGGIGSTGTGFGLFQTCGTAGTQVAMIVLAVATIIATVVIDVTRPKTTTSVPAFSQHRDYIMMGLIALAGLFALVAWGNVADGTPTTNLSTSFGGVTSSFRLSYHVGFALTVLAWLMLLAALPVYWIVVRAADDFAGMALPAKKNFSTPKDQQQQQTQQQQPQQQQQQDVNGATTQQHQPPPPSFATQQPQHQAAGGYGSAPTPQRPPPPPFGAHHQQQPTAS